MGKGPPGKVKGKGEEGRRGVGWGGEGREGEGLSPRTKILATALIDHLKQCLIEE